MERHKLSVIILNDFDMKSSIGITFQDYYDAVKGYGNVYSFPLMWTDEEYPGIKVEPDFFRNTFYNGRIKSHYLIHNATQEALGKISFTRPKVMLSSTGTPTLTNL